MRTVLLVLAGLGSVATARPAEACTAVVETYYKLDTRDPAESSQCKWDGEGNCHIELKWIKYGSGSPTSPVIVYNHGSGDLVQAAGAGSNSCFIADYFVPLGYTIYVPIRRGHYARYQNVEYPSTGKHYTQVSGDAIDELVKQKLDVKLAIVKIKQITNGDATKLALMGNSFGGMVSLFTNTMVLGQKAVVAFSPGGISWVNEGDPDDDTDDVPNTKVQNILKQHVTAMVSTPFFLQAKWDWDTRPTSELSYVFANSSILGGPGHGREYQASIFDFGTASDPQTTHEDFPKQTALWGPTVYAFLGRMGVK